MIRNSQERRYLGITRDTFIDITIRYDVNLADAWLGLLAWIRADLGARRHAHSVEVRVRRATDGINGPAPRRSIQSGTEPNEAVERVWRTRLADAVAETRVALTSG